MDAPAFDPVVAPRDSPVSAVRLPGFLIGGGLPFVVAVTALAAERTLGDWRAELAGVLGFLAFVGMSGVPIGAVLGGLFAPRAARAGSLGETVAIGLRVAGLAVVLGVVEVSAVFVVLLGAAGQAAGQAGDGVVTMAFGLAIVPVFGLLIFGLPAFLATAPIAIVGAALVRTLARSTRDATRD